MSETLPRNLPPPMNRVQLWLPSLVSEPMAEQAGL